MDSVTSSPWADYAVMNIFNSIPGTSIQRPPYVGKEEGGEDVLLRHLQTPLPRFPYQSSKRILFPTLTQSFPIQFFPSISPWHPFPENSRNFWFPSCSDPTDPCHWEHWENQQYPSFFGLLLTLSQKVK